MLLLKKAPVIIFLISLIGYGVCAQNNKINWSQDGLTYTKIKSGSIVRVDPRTDNETVLVTAEQLTPAGETKPLNPQSFEYSNDQKKVLLFTNTEKVWRYNTQGRLLGT